MEKTDWSLETKALIEPLLAPGEEVLAMGWGDLEVANTGKSLFADIPEHFMVKSGDVILTNQRVLFSGRNTKKGTTHFAVDGVAWSSIAEIIEPKPLLAAQTRYLNFMFAAGMNPHRPKEQAAIKTSFFAGLVPPRRSFHTDAMGYQKRFWHEAADIARAQVAAAHAVGTTPPALEQVSRTTRAVPVRARASASAGPKAPSAGRWLPILLWVLTAGALGFGAFCLLHYLDNQAYIARSSVTDAASTVKKQGVLMMLMIACGAVSALFIGLGVWLWKRGTRRAAAATIDTGG